jgi:hypothetical protein
VEVSQIFHLRGLINAVLVTALIKFDKKGGKEGDFSEISRRSRIAMQTP